MSDYSDDVGTLELADLVGLARRGRRGNPGRAARNAQARALIPNVPGVPGAAMRLQPLGLGSTAFTATSGTILALSASPQRPFKGMRLIVDITRTGATATGLVTITRLDVGTDNQLVGSGAISASAFAATSFDCNLSLAPATPGVLITVQFAISSAPTVADRVDIGCTIFGSAIG